MSRKAPRANRQILEEASTWFVAFRDQDLEDSARQGFHDWLKRSPEHIRAYLEIASIYADIPAPENGRTPPELIARARSSPQPSVVCLDSGELAAEGLQKPSRARGRDLRARAQHRFGLRVVAVALTLVLASTGAWFYAERNTYSTGIGEQRSITMPDGSIVELNARSRVRVAFRDRQRDVELIEGQALFRVARDPSRPFVVHAGAASVRAVGTQFDVYRKRAGISVTVIEGRVAVLSGPTPIASPVEAGTGGILLAAGEQALVTPARAEKASRPNIAAATAWTRHELVFDGTPLREVIEEFSRYSTRRLVIESPELAGLAISGQYTSTDPESLLRFLSLQKGVVIVQVNAETRIRKE